MDAVQRHEGPYDAVIQAVATATGVPIVDGVRSAVGIAESLVRRGLKTSKVRTYAPPRPKRVTGWPFTVD